MSDCCFLFSRVLIEKRPTAFANIFNSTGIRMMTMKFSILSFLLTSCSCQLYPDNYYSKSCRAPPVVKSDPTTGTITFQIGAVNRHWGEIPPSVNLTITYYDESTTSNKTIENTHTVTKSINMFLVSLEDMESTAVAMGRNLSLDMKATGLSTVTNLITVTFTPKSGVSKYFLSLTNIDPKTRYDDECTLELEVGSSYATSAFYMTDPEYTNEKYVNGYFLQSSDENAAPTITWEVEDDDWLAMTGNVSYVFRSPHNMMDIAVWAEGVFSLRYDIEVLRVNVKVDDKESGWRAWKGNFVRPKNSESEDDSFNRAIWFLLSLLIMGILMGVYLVAAGVVAAVRGNICCC